MMADDPNGTQEGEQKRSLDERSGASPPTKRARRAEPDVTVVVGQKEFQHYSHILCFSSDYFDAALSSGMKEAQESRFEFPDKDPEEWELFASFLEPCSTAQITEENVEKLIPWFHEFQVHKLLEKCEEVYQMKLFPEKKPSKYNPLESLRQLDTLLRAASFCSTYDLVGTKGLVMQGLADYLFKKNPDELLKYDVVITRILSLLEDDEFQGPFWSCVKIYLPATLQQEDPKSLLSNELFPHVLRAGIEKQASIIKMKVLEAEQNMAITGLCEIINAGKDFPRRLRNSLPKKNALKKKDECISAIAAERLQVIIEKDKAWTKWTQKQNHS